MTDPASKDVTPPPVERNPGKDAASITPALAAALEPTAIQPPATPVQDSPTLPASDSSLELVGGHRPKLPGYEILGVLERGGMGVIYKAVQTGINRVVALKMIRSGECADEQELVRFRVEAQAVAQLDHPHVVRIYDFGEWRPGEGTQTLPYFSMEYIDGGSLDKRLAKGPLPPRHAAELTEQLARAIHFVHQRGIVHRDMKPANVLLTSDGLPKIADFGLAKKLDGDMGLTLTKTVMGTASYMAPEQAAGKTRDVGASADIYAIGSILYEMLSGRPPFKADTREMTIFQVITEDPVPPTHHRSDVPAELEAICLKCLEKEPLDRFATAEALADDLRRWLNGEPISIAVTTEEDRHSRWARRVGYEIMDLLGCGRTGYVYKARQLSLNRLVTLKLLPAPAHLDKGEQSRFREEAESVARLQHSSIAQIYDLGEQQGQPYLVFEYLDGSGLAEKVSDAALPWRSAAEMAESLARTLQYAHQRGIIHYGLTPSCVLLTPDGVPKITRFGVARMLGQPSESGEEELAAQCVSSYAAPEQIDGLPEEISPTVDVYALGAILYFLLTGRPPFVAVTLEETRQQILNTDPVRPSQFRVDLPPDLEAACLKCLAKNPAHRFQSMEALAKELQRILSADHSRGELNLMSRLSRTAIPGYVISGELGHTPLMTVHKALQVSHQRIVALKVIPTVPRLAADYRQTLERTMRIAHPNIARIHEVGMHGNALYFAEELLSGGSIRRQIDTPIEPRRAARIIESLSRAMDVAHEHGIPHGGLRPSIVLLSAEGEPKITDFGLPAPMPTYTAPEDLDIPKRTPAGDIYALGAILYHLMAGQPPFRGDTSDELKRQISSADVVTPTRLQPDIPPALEEICFRCLQKSPTARYSSAGALAEDLQRFSEGGGLSGFWKQISRWFTFRKRKAD